MSEDTSATEAERFAAETLDGAADAPRVGRPKGSRDRKPRKRRGGSLPPRERREPEPAEPVDTSPPSEAEITGAGKMLGVLWRLAGARMNRRPLLPNEERELSEAAVPVMRKYGAGFLDQWGAEIGLAFVVLGLWEKTKLPLDGEPVFELASADPENPAGEVAGA